MDNYYEYVKRAINTVETPPLVTLDDIKYKIPYTNKIRAEQNLHIGQRKLFLNELQFLSYIYKKVDYVIYAGAAPGNHMYLLSTLFAKLKFILIDPNNFAITITTFASHKQINNNVVFDLTNVNKDNWLNLITTENYRIYTIQDYFDNNLASMFKNLNHVFISDIRTNDNDEAPSDLDLVWNSSMQFNWVNIMSPKSFMLKFRCPYFIANSIEPMNYQKKDFELSKKFGIDFVTNYNNKNFTYLDGIINLQPWAPKHSTETRLVNTKIILKEYNSLEYEQKLYYYNTIDRMFMFHTNVYTDPTKGIDHCQDCALENKIWTIYSEMVDNIDYPMSINTLTSLLRRNLFEGEHGYLNKPDYNWYFRRLNYKHLDLNKIKLIIKPINHIITAKTFKSFFNYESFIENITNKLTPPMKKKYLEEMLFARKHPMKKISYRVDSMNNQFPMIYGAKLFKTSPTIPEYGVFMTLINCLTCYPVKYLLLSGKGFLYPIVKQITSYFNIIICHFDLEGKKNFDTFPNKNGYYTFSDKIYNIKLSKDILDQCLFYTNYTPNKFLDCEEYAGAMAYNYVNIMSHNYKYFLTVLKVQLDSFCSKQINYNTDTIIQSKKLGYDIEDMLKNNKFLYFDGTLYKIPYWGKLITDYMILGKGNNKKLIEYDRFLLEEKGVYLNNFTRNFQLFPNPNIIKNIGFDYCHDCAMVNLIWSEYAKKFNLSNKWIQEQVIKFHKLYPLRGGDVGDSHGLLFDTSDNTLMQSFLNSGLDRIQLRKIPKTVGGKISRHFVKINRKLENNLFNESEKSYEV